MILRKDTYPRAILHIDGDAFFAACEVTKDPSLRGKPVIVGSERGIASAMTYEAKACGVTRAMRGFEIKRICPQAIFLPSDYETYNLYSRRMYEIVRRYTPDIEEYSIDECFADITGLRRPLKMSYEKIATAIKNDLQNELGLTFSVGLSINKVLAKIGSKFNKPNGLTFIPGNKIHTFLAETKIEKIWGIGPNTSALLKKYGIITGLDFALKNRDWVTNNFSKPLQEIHQELLGEYILSLATTKQKHNRASISRTRTFQPSTDKKILWSELSKNVENACDSLRQQKIFANKFSIFLKTQDFQYFKADLSLARPTCFPQDILVVAQKHFDALFRPNILYRTTGIDLHDLSEEKTSTLNLFDNNDNGDKLEKIYEKVDEINDKFDDHPVILGSSLQKTKIPSWRNKKNNDNFYKKYLLDKKHRHEHLNLPFLGLVT